MQKENSYKTNNNPTTTGSRLNSLPYEGRAGDGSSPLPTREGHGGGSVLRPYGRSELAQLYYGRPVSDCAARKWFMKELSYVPGLMDRLKALGLTPHGKIFSRAQVEAIFEALGEP